MLKKYAFTFSILNFFLLHVATREDANLYAIVQAWIKLAIKLAWMTQSKFSFHSAGIIISKSDRWWKRISIVALKWSILPKALAQSALTTVKHLNADLEM